MQTLLRVCAMMLACALPQVTFGASDDGARVALALRQATLVQGMSASACFAMGGVDAQRQGARALELSDTYRTTLGALRDGHDWLGLTPVSDASSLAAIETASHVWRGYVPSIRQIIAGDLHSVVMRHIMIETDLVTDSANSLAAHFLDNSADLKLSEDAARAAQAAASVRMLTQRALREGCYVRFALGGDEMRTQLVHTLRQIDTLFVRLAEGDAELAPPPDARVARNFRTAQLFWSKMRPTLDAMHAGEAVDDITVQKMLKLNTSVLKQMDQAVDGYFK
ncbi:hypothetical protein [Tateyamaria sp. SN6-1]|uniref:hypothetical protein n=1 Tax=Tateyamaria sp. SN6-1 TaxID=3092148 RepID=UPI0039F51AFB